MRNIFVIILSIFCSINLNCEAKEIIKKGDLDFLREQTNTTIGNIQNDAIDQHNTTNQIQTNNIVDPNLLNEDNLVDLGNGWRTRPNLELDSRRNSQLLTSDGQPITADYIRQNTNFIYRQWGQDYPFTLSNLITDIDSIGDVGITINGQYIPNSDADVIATNNIRLKLMSCLRRSLQ